MVITATAAELSGGTCIPLPHLKGYSFLCALINKICRQSLISYSKTLSGTHRDLNLVITLMIRLYDTG